MFIYDLLYGNIEEEEQIITRGEALGWNLQRPHCVAVFELDQYEPYSEDKQLIEILYDSVEGVLLELDEKGILMRKKGEVILIIPKSRETRREQRSYMKMLVAKVKAVAEQRLPERNIKLGVGRIYDSPAEIFRSYQEAKVALELGALMTTQVSTPFFIEMGLARILYNHDTQELKQFYQETLGELERQDSLQNGDLMNTLEMFLVHRCDLKATANAIFLHPNTLRYRLKKIEELLGADLDDLDTKLSVMAAFKIKYLARYKEVF